MEYVLLAGAAIGTGIYYLLRQHWQQQHPAQPRQTQTGARVESEEVPCSGLQEVQSKPISNEVISENLTPEG